MGILEETGKKIGNLFVAGENSVCGWGRSSGNLRSCVVGNIAGNFSSG